MSLRRYIVKRLLVSIPLLVAVSMISFLLVHLAPGDAVDYIMGFYDEPPPGLEEQLRFQYGLDQPIYIQYIDWLGGVLQGDFGETFTRGPDAGALIRARLAETLLLGLFGWVFAIVIAIPGGIYAATRKNQLGDDVSRFVALAGISMPNFWLGLLLIAIFAVELDWFPVLDPQTSLFSFDMLWWMLLPGLTVGTAASANLMRIMRTAMTEEMNKPYVTTARAKGLPRHTIVLKHVLRNSLISVTTIAAFITAGIISGAVIVEFVFGWPGLGLLLVDATFAREINLLTGILLLTGVAIILANLIADIIYGILDPRIREEY